MSVFAESWSEFDRAAAAATYRAAKPFPHAVLDGMIDPTFFAEVAQEFPGLDSPSWTNYLHVNERKRGNMQMDAWPQKVQELATELISPEFISFLEDLTGITGLLPDPSFDGGGLHRSERGGFLNIHADFTAHHVHQDWERRVNVLLYMNEEWHDEWGGHLELWTADMSTKVSEVAPSANRMVVFTTTSTSYHGHPTPLTCPEGMARKSMALYYFTAGSEKKPHSTDYRARPEDGAKKVAIYADAKAIKLYDIIKRKTGGSDNAASKWLNKIFGGGSKHG